MKNLALLLLFVLLSTLSSAQPAVQMDTSTIQNRSFSSDELKEIKSKREFQYDRFVEPPQSLWDRFWAWFWFKVYQILNTEGGRNTMWTVFAVLGTAIIVFFVLKVMGMNKSGLFGRSSRDGLNYTISTDDIHQISFDEAIRAAVESGNYRLATRLLYLQVLKKLSDRGYINWQINKTNIDYLNETAGKQWSSLFSSVTFSFEYSWYGELPVSKERFTDLQQQFHQLNNQL
jgi:hypothetical protein